MRLNALRRSLPGVFLLCRTSSSGGGKAFERPALRVCRGGKAVVCVLPRRSAVVMRRDDPPLGCSKHSEERSLGVGTQRPPAAPRLNAQRQGADERLCFQAGGGSAGALAHRSKHRADRVREPSTHLLTTHGKHAAQARRED
jgi:hypothetical protein